MKFGPGSVPFAVMFLTFALLAQTLWPLCLAEQIPRLSFYCLTPVLLSAVTWGFLFADLPIVVAIFNTFDGAYLLLNTQLQYCVRT